MTLQNVPILAWVRSGLTMNKEKAQYTSLVKMVIFSTLGNWTFKDLVAQLIWKISLYGKVAAIAVGKLDSHYST